MAPPTAAIEKEVGNATVNAMMYKEIEGFKGIAAVAERCSKVTDYVM
jgi:hypothetical protein